MDKRKVGRSTMGFLSWLIPAASVDEKLADGLAELILVTTRGEAERCGKILVIGPTSPLRLRLEFEIAFILISVVEKFVLRKVGEPRRSWIIDSVINQVRDRTLPRTDEATSESNKHQFDMLLGDRREGYGNVRGLTGENSLHDAGGWNLVSIPPQRLPNAVPDTFKTLTNALTTFVNSSPVKELLAEQRTGGGSG